MEAFGFEEMQAIQKELQEKYKNQWEPLSPKAGRNKLLWMLAEAGEVAEVIKKQGDRAIMEDEAVRAHFVEELCDVMMYFNDVMLCYSVTPEELASEYRKKHKKNMERW